MREASVPQGASNQQPTEAEQARRAGRLECEYYSRGFVGRRLTRKALCLFGWIMTPERLISSLSLLLSLCALVVSVVLFRKTRQGTVQPMLVFARRDDDKLWHLQNVGNGPALNLVVVEGHRAEGWATTTNCDAPAAGGSIALSWLKIASKLGAAYTDVYGRPYHTICEQYRNRITPGKLTGIPTASQHEFHVRSHGVA